MLIHESLRGRPASTDSFRGSDLPKIQFNGVQKRCCVHVSFRTPVRMMWFTTNKNFQPTGRLSGVTDECE